MFNNVKKMLFLGPTGSYTEAALSFFMKHFGINAKIEPVSTIKKIVGEADKNKNTYAVIPVENLIEGIVRETVDALLTTKSNVQILAQTMLPISHCLISKGELNEIKTIISHPQAINQCQKFIAENFKNDINIQSATSTSYATKSLLELNSSYASIGSEFCAKLYGLNILAKNINDVKRNKTRFIMIGQGENDLKQDRTSVVFSTKNEPGALLSVLNVFKKYELNLIYIESRPSKKEIGDYIFFADIDKGICEIKSAISEIGALCSFFKILGSYSNIKYKNVL